MLNPAHGNPVYAVLCCFLVLQLFLQRTLAQAQGSGDPCTTDPICSPSAGTSWIQDSLMSVIWNPKKTAPFDQYDKVDVYIVDDANSTHAILLQKDIDLNLGMMAARLDVPFFPNDTPLNRSCHIVMVGNGNELNSTHVTLNSNSFYMIRTKQLVSGTMVTVTSTPTILTSPASVTLGTSTPTPYTTNISGGAGGGAGGGGGGGFPTNLSPEKSSALSPLVIGLISAGCVTLMIAIVAIGLLLRTQRRSKGDSGHFKSLDDHPNSPTDDASKSSIYKGEGSFVGPAIGSAIPTGRSSITTTRSAAEPVKGASSILGYNNQSPTSPVGSMPLLERKPSTHYRDPEPVAPAVVSEGPRTSGDLEEGVRPQQGSALTAGDAHLIAETFRKSMRRPCWEDNDADTDADEDEQDEARRAANQLLKEQLSEQGLDVRRCVQRRVTIQDRINRQSVPAPISHMEPLPDS